ncbi:microfibrillar-associated protein 1 [Sarcoptes scabiei]|nr:microfibrillar-associated protein 1 [Sarcoptes scabiei]
MVLLLLVIGLGIRDNQNRSDQNESTFRFIPRCTFRRSTSSNDQIHLNRGLMDKKRIYPFIFQNADSQNN